MKENNTLKWSLIASIVIIANLFFNYAASLAFNSPEYDDFCSYEQTAQLIEDKEMCEQQDGIWNPSQKTRSSMSPISDQVINPSTPESAGYCDLYTKCNDEYQVASEAYERKVFVTLMIVGVLVIIGSFITMTNHVLTSAFALTAVLNFIIASIRYWRFADELLKVSILFVALAILIYLAIKKFNQKV